MEDNEGQEEFEAFASLPVKPSASDPPSLLPKGYGSAPLPILVSASTDSNQVPEPDEPPKPSIPIFKAYNDGEGAVFYYNAETGQSTWDRPTLKALKAKKTIHPDWRKIHTNIGQIYYFNVQTKEATWIIPSMLSGDQKQTVEIESEKENLPDLVDTIKDTQEEAPSIKIKQEVSDEELETKEIKEEKPLKEEESEESEPEVKPKEPEKPELSLAERIEIFKEMLKEKNIKPFTSFEKALPKFAFDDRFKIIPSHTERKAIFENFMKTRGGQEKQERKSKLNAARDSLNQLVASMTHKTTFEEFKDLLKNDTSYQSLRSKDQERLYKEKIEPLKQAKEQESKNLKESAKENLIKLFKSQKDITSKTNWAKAKKLIESFPEYLTEYLTSHEKEALFKDYIHTLNEQEKEQRRQESLKEREREVQRSREREEKERDRVQQRHKRQEFLTNYQILLKERIRDPEASWTKNKRMLDLDPRSYGLSIEEKEEIFREHIKKLHDALLYDFKSLLSEAAKLGKILPSHTSLDQISQLIRDDPRYDKIHREDREVVFERFMREFKRDVFSNFRTLLKESKNTGLLSSKTPTSGPKFEQLKQLLKPDNRYSALDSLPTEREKEIIYFIENIGKDKPKE